MKSFRHPSYVDWDFAQALPIKHDALVEIEGDFIKSCQFTKLVIHPLEIQGEGNPAVIHLDYNDVISDSTGKKMSASGRWTTRMLKRDKKWVIISQIWIEKLEGMMKKLLPLGVKKVES